MTIHIFCLPLLVVLSEHQLFEWYEFNCLGSLYVFEYLVSSTLGLGVKFFWVSLLPFTFSSEVAYLEDGD